MNLLDKLYRKLLNKFSTEHLSEFKAYSKVDEIMPTLIVKSSNEKDDELEL